ncbi:sigma factor [Halalkalibacter sp. APA_J-10(15)]|uniref:sigma factor n=1 Tax=Halalkalibacter sp. APA_J-10(15) TaxID=2933805 RepID=UPI001FF22E86|nr:sigma factor [Halalkalibacter sp. APA_J-10(15)]MCK0470269.1 hypothetical protein [Halalkalibacter sp. APA_J-10(15)]
MVFEFSAAIFKFILIKIRNVEHAEDLTQETFLKSYRHVEFLPGSSLKSWLFSITYNVTVDFSRKQKPIYVFKNILNVKDIESLPEEVVQILKNQGNYMKVLKI